VYNLNASWKESMNVIMFDWFQKEFSRQMRMAAKKVREGLSNSVLMNFATWYVC
jgi:ligand-binding sensor protein